MNDELVWHIGKEAAPLDAPPLRAYFYWKRDGQIMKAADFSKDELKAEIARLRLAGEDVVPFESALARL